MVQLISTIRWRDTKNIHSIRSKKAEEIVQCDIALFETCYSSGIVGLNIDGGPIVLRKFGRFDLIRLGEVCGNMNSEESAIATHTKRRPRLTPTQYFQEFHIYEMEWYFCLLKRSSYEVRRW